MSGTGLNGTHQPDDIAAPNVRPPPTTNVRRWAVGTKNKAKVKCVELCVNKMWPHESHLVGAVEVKSAVSAQPMTAAETMAGAMHRAKAALELIPEAQFGVGLEGGLETIGDATFECGWMCVVERSTKRVGWGSSARFQMSTKLLTPIVRDGKELAEVIDALTGETDVRSNLGAMGVLTNGHLGRTEAYSHGMLFALAPFCSSRELFWD